MPPSRENGTHLSLYDTAILAGQRLPAPTVTPIDATDLFAIIGVMKMPTMPAPMTLERLASLVTRENSVAIRLVADFP